ncbi:hypothetical protein [Ferrimonas pelagia]
MNRLLLCLLLITMVGCVSTPSQQQPLLVKWPQGGLDEVTLAPVKAYLLEHQGEIVLLMGPVADLPAWQQAHVGQQRLAQLLRALPKDAERIQGRFTPSMASNGFMISVGVPNAD